MMRNVTIIILIILLLVCPVSAWSELVSADPEGTYQPGTGGALFTPDQIVWVPNGQQVDIETIYGDISIYYSNAVSDPSTGINCGYNSAGSSGNGTVTFNVNNRVWCFYENSISRRQGYFGYYVNDTMPAWVDINAAFSGSPTSGFVPLTVSFTDSSTGGPTSWLWDFGDGSNSTLQSPSHQYTSAGTYTVKLYASKTGSSDWENKTSYITVNAYSAPMCSYTATTYTGSSPYDVTFNDTSGNSPTTSYWNFDSEDQPWISVSPSKTSSLFNTTVTYSGTGSGYIMHWVSNPAGTSNCALKAFNISGIAPTPTPTPSIPFPNQTGICQYASISLGSGTVESYERYCELLYPSGSSSSTIFPSGDTALISSNLFTTQLGTYIYNQYNSSGQLEYRSSYVVQDCSGIPTETPTIIPTQTTLQTFPTVTGTLGPQWTMKVTPTIQPYSTIPPTLPTIPEGALNATRTEQILIDFSPALQTYTNMVKGVFTDANNMFMWPVVLALSPISNIVNMITFILSLFTQYLTTFTPMFTLPYQVFVSLINSIHWKIKAVISFGLVVDTILMVYYLKRSRF